MAPNNQSRAKAYLDQESSFRGQYSKQVFQTLYFAYKPAFTRIAVLLIVGFFARLSLLSNANVIGIWVDTFCRAPSHGWRALPGDRRTVSG